jgi:hypothetical protein
MLWSMSYRTVEVELEDGRVAPCGSERLPAKAHALLTILSPVPTASSDAPPPSLAELVGDLAGIGRGQYTDLSTNKDHLADLGQ